jgi:S-adenosylmethionine synthetase
MVEPLSVYINTYGTGKIKDVELVDIINKIFDLTPRGIREMLNLSNVNYLSTAAYGHFGRESVSSKSFTWEKTDKAKSILEAVG